MTLTLAITLTLQGENKMGFSAGGNRIIGSLPLETCDTIGANGIWGYTQDHTVRSLPDLIHTMIGAAGRGANYLLNLGPKPDGSFTQASQDRLLEIGRWLKGARGESYFGTEKGPVDTQLWGVTTQLQTNTSHKVYVHILRPFHVAPKPGAGLMFRVPLPKVRRLEVSLAQELLSGQEVLVEDVDGGVTVVLGPKMLDPIDTIIVLHMQSGAA